jgi:regulator of protease activity HflC (stomatin/prohibitin superfamily)
MSKLIFAGVLLIAAYAAWRVSVGLAGAALAQRRDPRVLVIVGRAVGVGLAAAAVLILVFSTVVVVPAGHVGVIQAFGRVESRPIYEGLNLVAPWKDVQEMSIQVQKKTGRFDAASRDLQAVHVDMTINYRLLADKAPEVYRTVGVKYADTIIGPAEQETLKAHTALYNASDILHQRPKLKAEIHDELGKWLTRYGLQLAETSISNIAFDAGYAKAIEAKQIQEQLAEQKRYEVVQAQRQAEIAAATAKGQADAAREAAKGEADALKFKGEAQAEYNRRVSASLTTQLVAQQWIDAWKSGGARVPQLTGGGQNFLMQIPLPDLGKPSRAAD